MLAGEPTRRAVELCLDEIRAAGGLEIDGRRRPVTLLVETDDGTREDASRAALELINRRGATALIGSSYSRLAIPAGEIAEQAGVPMIVPAATHPDVTAGRRYVFRVIFTDPVQAAAMANFARRHLGLETAAALYDITDAYNRDIAESFRDAFEADGGRIVAFETFTSRDVDFQPQLQRIRAAAPDALFLPNYNALLELQATQVRALGIEAVLLGTDAWLPERMNDPSLLDGAFFSQPWHPEMASGDGRARRFTTLWKETYGESPGIIAALAYDACHLLLEAISRAGQVDPSAIRDALADGHEHLGVTGGISYRESGDPRRPVAVLQMRGGSGHFDRWIAVAAD